MGKFLPIEGTVLPGRGVLCHWLGTGKEFWEFMALNKYGSENAAIFCGQKDALNFPRRGMESRIQTEKLVRAVIAPRAG